MTDFERGAEEFRAEVSSWLETEGYESAARVVGAWPLPAQPLGESREARLEALLNDIRTGISAALGFERGLHLRQFIQSWAKKIDTALDARPSPSSEKQGDKK